MSRQTEQQRAAESLRQFEAYNDDLNRRLEERIRWPQLEQLQNLQNQLARTRELRRQMVPLQAQFLQLQPGPERTRVGQELITIYRELGITGAAQTISDELNRSQAPLLSDQRIQGEILSQEQSQRVQELQQYGTDLQRLIARSQAGPERTRMEQQLEAVILEVTNIMLGTTSPQVNEPGIPEVIIPTAQDTALVNEHVGLVNQLYSIPQGSTVEDTLLRDSHETLVKQLYGFPVQTPEFLIVNDLRANFIPFDQMAQMLQSNQIERYVLDSMLQPWAGPPNKPNRILTMFGKNGITYLVKAQYNQVNNQIYPPV
jgi:hypothetical protein